MILDNCTFCWVHMQEPTTKWQSTDTQYAVDCVISKDARNAWNKAFPKQKAREVPTSEFKDKFRIDPPFPSQDEQYIIKLAKDAVVGGKPFNEKYRPRVFKANQGGGPPIDVTFTVQIGNGSKGKLSYDSISNTFGTFAKLNSILVEHLVEYVGGSGPGGDFGATPAAAPADEGEYVKTSTGDDVPF